MAAIAAAAAADSSSSAVPAAAAIPTAVPSAAPTHTSAATAGSATAAPTLTDSAPSSSGADKDHLTIKVVSQSGDEVHFRLRKTIAFKKMFNAYAKKTGQPVEGLRFLFDGDRIKDNDTPALLEMQDGDSVDAMVQQTGGIGQLLLL